MKKNLLSNTFIKHMSNLNPKPKLIFSITRDETNTLLPIIYKKAFLTFCLFFHQLLYRYQTFKKHSYWSIL